MSCIHLSQYNKHAYCNTPGLFLILSRGDNLGLLCNSDLKALKSLCHSLIVLIIYIYSETNITGEISTR